MNSAFRWPNNRKTEFVSKKAPRPGFNLSNFGALIKQSFRYRSEEQRLYFGVRAEDRTATSLHWKPDFTLPDLNGKRHSAG